MQLQPEFAEAHFNLGNALTAKGQLVEAAACYGRTLQLQPEFAECTSIWKSTPRAGEVGRGRRLLSPRPAAEAGFCRGTLQSRQSLPGPGTLGRSGRLLPAGSAIEARLRRVARQPGPVFQRLRKPDYAAACYRRLLELKPDSAPAHNALGDVLQEQGKLDEAIACYQRSVQLQPDFADAHGNLGKVFLDQKKFDQAAAWYRQASQLKPDSAEVCCSLGNALMGQGKLEEAAGCYRRALELKPDFAGAHYNLGLAFNHQGKLDEAAACCRRALQLEPDYAEAYDSLGLALQYQGKGDAATACYRRALELKADLASAHGNLGSLLRSQGKLDEAVACYRRAVELKPKQAEAHANLGVAFAAQGRFDEAVACFRQAPELKPDDSQACSDLLLTLQYRAGTTLCRVGPAHAEYEQRHAEPLRSTWPRHENVRNPDRMLRVGFVSADFGRHPVGYFLIRVLENLDRDQAGIVCYSDRIIEDDLTRASGLRRPPGDDVVGSSDEQLAEEIRPTASTSSSTWQAIRPATGCWCSPASRRRWRSPGPATWAPPG